MNKIIAIIGARPQFIKHYPVELAAEGNFEIITIHTGQHYDENMSSVFFTQFGMKKPTYMLSLGGGSHSLQTGKMLIEIGNILEAEKPQGVIVYGDTNSTLAGALAASKIHIPIFHIEAGLRSYNRNMPEEINRVLTDHISSLLLVPSIKAVKNLNDEGIRDKIHVVGDVMKDMIRIMSKRKILKLLKVDDPYYYVTLHRPYNVDDKERLEYILKSLQALDRRIVFSIHPRTRIKIKEFNIRIDQSMIRLIDPQPYFENLNLLLNSSGLITDSGGMQKEAYWLKKKCITLRSETEWLETLNGCANELFFEDLSNLNLSIKKEIEYWDSDLYGDSFSADKIVKLIKSEINS